MKRHDVTLVALVVCLVVSLFFVIFNFQDRLSQVTTEFETYKTTQGKVIQELQEVLGERESEVLRLQKETDSLRKDVDSLENQVSDYMREIERLEGELALSESERESLIEENRLLIEEIEKLKREQLPKFAKLTIIACWKKGSVVELKLENVTLSVQGLGLTLLSLDTWTCTENGTVLFSDYVPISLEPSVVLFKCGSFSVTERFYSVVGNNMLVGDVIHVGHFESVIVVSEDMVYYEWW